MLRTLRLDFSDADNSLDAVLSSFLHRLFLCRSTEMGILLKIDLQMTNDLSHYHSFRNLCGAIPIAS